MILLVSNREDATADFFQAKLREADVPHIRLDTEGLATMGLSFASHASAHEGGGAFRVGQQRVAFADLRAVYYRRPISPSFPPHVEQGQREWMQNETRRAWGGALAAQLSLRWVNHPLNISAANYKPEQLARAARSGLLVPDTLITTVAEEAAVFCERHDWSVVTKPIGHGEILGAHDAEDQIVFTNLLSPGDRAHLNDVTACPTLLQQAISKDVDVRATIVEQDVIAVALHSQERVVSQIDCRRDNMTGMRYSAVVLPADLCDSLTTLVRSYGLYYAAIDLVRDLEGRYWFLELNPAGQWAWLEQLAAAPISSALIRCLSRD